MDGKVEAEFAGVDTYKIPGRGDEIAVDVVRERATWTAAAALVGREKILDARYLSTGTTRLVGKTSTVDEVTVQVFNLDSNAETYVLVATEREHSPHRGDTQALPGRIEAENCDQGGSGAAYEDTTEQNTGRYRDGAVDIEEITDEDGGHNLAWIETGEWTEYTVETVPGTYEACLCVASVRGDGHLELLLDGSSLGTVDVPKTGGWQNWETVTIPGLELDAGQDRVLRVEAMEGGHNLNWIEFVDLTTESGDWIPAPASWSYSARGYGKGTYGGINA